MLYKVFLVLILVHICVVTGCPDCPSKGCLDGCATGCFDLFQCFIPRSCKLKRKNRAECTEYCENTLGIGEDNPNHCQCIRLCMQYRARYGKDDDHLKKELLRRKLIVIN